nr:ribonuclease H-like domain-containing protein [Tanacetum cinerariifolium]
MANEEENHALVADDEAPTEFALMAKSSLSSENEVYNDSFCSKSCRKNTDSLNTKLRKLNEELSDSENTLYHYKLGLSQVEARLVEFKTQEIKFCEKIRGLKFNVEVKNNTIEHLMNELEQVKKEKEGLDRKLTGFEFASKDLDTLLGRQRTDKNKEGLGYSVVPPLLLKPSPSIESKTSDLQNTDSPTIIKTNKVETERKSPVKYAEMYRNTSKILKLEHMIGNISYLSEYEPYDGGYVSFGQGGGKITGKDFKLKDDTNVLLRTPRQHNMYSIDLNSIVPHKDLTCLVVKTSADESMLWHRRLVVTNDFSRFTWNFFLKTKDETSGILRNFITEIENLKDLKVKLIRCDNEGEFKNKEMNDFCTRKGIKREFNNARTP